jgi:C_GCAxxG_C_C family probable redox protein
VIKPVEIAASLFDQGFSCSQSVFSAFAPQLDIPRELALKIGAPFGGGMARQGEVCGAVTGALMVLGVKFGYIKPQDRDATYAVCQEFIRRFKACHTTILCRELTGYNLSIPAELERFRKLDVSEIKCPLFVQNAAEIITLLLENK